MNKLNLSEIISGLVLSEPEAVEILAKLDALAETQEQRNTVAYLRKGWNFIMSQPILDADEPRPADSLDDSALALALEFHRTYELLAPNFGYKTQMATRVFDPDSPNGRLMIAVCAEILARRARRPT